MDLKTVSCWRFIIINELFQRQPEKIVRITTAEVRVHRVSSAISSSMLDGHLL